MPKKLLHPDATPTIVQERLRVWGQCIHKQRLAQQITANDLCRRMGISDATLRRMERGDPGAGAGLYLSALLVLGVLDAAVPIPERAYWEPAGRRRVVPRSTDGDDLDF